jgi:copper transport protein
LWLSIRAEYLLFAAVLALTAALGQLQPPRALVLHDAHALQAGQAAFAATAADGRYRITLLVTPARAGHNGVAVEVQDDAGRRVDAKEAMLELALPSAGIEPLQRRATREASGRFVYHGTDLAPAGRWRVVARVLIDDFTQASAVFEVPVR